MASLDRRHLIHLGPGRVHRLLAVVKAWHHPLVGPPVLLGHQRLLERPSDLLSLIHLALLDQTRISRVVWRPGVLRLRGLGQNANI